MPVMVEIVYGVKISENTKSCTVVRPCWLTIRFKKDTFANVYKVAGYYWLFEMFVHGLHYCPSSTDLARFPDPLLEASGSGNLARALREKNK